MLPGAIGSSNGFDQSILDIFINTVIVFNAFFDLSNEHERRIEQRGGVSI